MTLRKSKVRLDALSSTTADIEQRFGYIALHHAELNRVSKELSLFHGADLIKNSPNSEATTRLCRRWESEEVRLIHELVHLHDNVKRYMEVRKRDLDELEIVTKFEFYRAASCFTNTMKHGVEGGRQSAKIDFSYFLFSKAGESASPQDPIVGILHIVNFRGRLFSCKSLIDSLSALWKLFMTYHTDLDVSRLFRPLVAKDSDQPKSYYKVTFDIDEVAAEIAAERYALKSKQKAPRAQR